MKFRFRLETALNFAKLKEKRKQKELTKAKHTLELMHEDARRGQRNLWELLEKRDLRWSPFVSTQAEVETETLGRLEGEIEEQQFQVEQRQYEWQKLHREKKAIENLKEKRFSDFKKARSKQSQKELEESFRLLTSKKRS